MMESVAVVAAHPDDEVLGCGGTIAKMVAEGCHVEVLLVADGETARSPVAERALNNPRLTARKASAEAACAALGCKSVEVLTLPDNRLDSCQLLDVVKLIETFLARCRPRTVFTHHRSDVNVDHRVVHDAVIAACRPQPGHFVETLLFFEVPSSTEWRPAGSTDSFEPNWFVDITTTIEVKMAALQSYESEMREFPHPRSFKAVRALAEWRGATVGVPAAEAFVLGRRLVK